MLYAILLKGGGGIESWRGNFCGCYYDKANQCGSFFTDHFGSEPIFYYHDDKYLLISSSVNALVQFLRTAGKRVNVSMAGAYSMLALGFMYDNYTPFEGIYKLLPGTSINILPGGNISEPDYYHKLCEPEHENTDLDYVTSRMSELFLEAMTLQVEKNREYGLDNYSAISAGLDSRMTCFALRRLGVDNAVLFTYSQTGQMDNVVPGKIASYLHYPWLFKSLDNGLDMLDIDQAITLSDSLIYYMWPSQLYSFLRLVDRERMGIIHTGVVGDVVAGSYCNRFNTANYSVGDGDITSYDSDWLKDKLKSFVREREYKNYEAGMMYNRGMNGVVMGYSTSFVTCGEAVSPFMYVDFFDLCMSVPFKYRTAHYLYYKWVNEFMPDASRFRYNGLRIHSHKRFIEFRNRYISLNGVCDMLIHAVESRLGFEAGMNPSSKWYNENVRLKNFMDLYFRTAVDFVEDKELREDMIKLYGSDNVRVKIKCISLAGSIQKFLC